MVVSFATLGLILLGVIYLVTHPVHGINAQLDARRGAKGRDNEALHWATPEMYSPRVRPSREKDSLPRTPMNSTQALTEDSPEWAAYSKTLGL